LPKREAPEAASSRMIERLSSGDSEAWSEFIGRYRRLIYSAIHRANERFGAQWDETTQDELFEEAMFKLLRNRGRALRSWKGQCRLETWIYRIVRNACIDRLRQEGRRAEVQPTEQLRGSGATAAPGVSRMDSASSRDLRISLEQAIEQALTDREALAVKLIYFEGFTYSEAAEKLDVSVGAMSGLVYRALAKLRADGGVARYWEREP
jgi:RNA polymerase sigma-70 factor (ECF subfamily)